MYTDFTFLIKIALYFLVGTLWIAFDGSRWIPAGIILGFIASQFEVLRIDRKIEYVALVIGGVFGLYGLGITIGF